MRRKRSPIQTPKRIISIKSKQKVDDVHALRVDALSAKEKPVIMVQRRLGGIGDVIMTTPLLKAIKRLIPHSHLIYATDVIYAEKALVEIIEHCPYVDEIIPVSKIPNTPCDYSVDVTTTGLVREKPGLIPPNRIDMFAEAAGLSVVDDPLPVYIINQEEDAQIKEEFSDLFNGRNVVIGIQTRSNDSRRTWPTENLKDLIALLLDKTNYKVALLDWGHTTSEWDAFCEGNERLISFTNRTIADTAPFINLCDLIVCPDSSVLHLAGALNKKIVSIFGPIANQSRINHYPNATAIQLSSCRWSPCWYSPKCMHNSPKNAKLSCLKNITAEMVYNAIEKKLKENISDMQLTKPSKQENILIKRTSRGLGDMLMAQTGIEALKNKFPNKKIYLYCPKETHAVLKYNPNIFKLIDSSSENINYSDYCLIYDITSSCARYETARVKLNKLVEKNRVEIYAEALGVRNLITNLLPRYYGRQEEIVAIKKHLSLKAKKKTIFIAPNSGETYRNWPKENIKVLIDLLKNDYNVILQDKEYVDESINIISPDMYTIRDTASIIELSDLVVTIDSAPLHLAAAKEKKTIALFGPIDYKARCRGYKNITILKSNKSCIPCWRNGTIKCKLTNTHESKCLSSITGKQVYKIIREIINE